MNAPAPSPGLLAFVAESGVTAQSWQPLIQGRNSRVWRIDAADGYYVVKEYPRDPTDSRDRLGVEYDFLHHLQARGIARVPRPLARQPAERRALYSGLPGAPVQQPTDQDLRQAAAFIHAINQDSTTETAHRLPLAADACLSLDDHINRIGERLARLDAALRGGHDRESVIRSAREFLQDALQPRFRQLAAAIRAGTSSAVLARPLTASERILSPSDFGFHNTLKDQGQLHFFDFEYAGWDDPAKLACDFIAQPEYRLSPCQAGVFLDALGEQGPFEGFKLRVECLLSLHRLKWCAIIMKAFHAPECPPAGLVAADTLTIQLDKATRYFEDRQHDDSESHR